MDRSASTSTGSVAMADASRRAFFEIVREGVGPADAESVEQAIRSEQARLADERAAWVTDHLTAAHFEQTSRVLAANRVLTAHLPKDLALELLRRALVEPWRELLGGPVGRALDASPDPLLMLVESSKAKEEHVYGPSFEFEREQDDADTYLLNVRRCYFHQYFGAHGVPELTTVFCDWDSSWIGAIDPARHGVRFERPTTLGYGGDCCRFQFRREARHR
jgi:L-2-amino-thiazoline-4-carboxylic acid hydrolase